MRKFVLSRPGGVVESVYNLELSEEDWIRQITQGLDPFMDGGNGTLGCVMRMGRQVEMPVLSPCHADDEVPAFIQYLRESDEARTNQKAAEALLSPGLETSKLHDAMRFGQLFAKSGMGTLSVNRQNQAAYEVFIKAFSHHGIRDAAGLIVPHHASRSFIFFTARQHEMSEVPQRARTRWTELQSHIAAVYDLRHRLRADTFVETDAVWFDTGGKCVESGPALKTDIRERLRNAVLTYEKNRSQSSSEKRVELEQYWSSVLSGKWAIMDRFDSDGRRFLIAIPVSKYGDGIRGLSAREREVLNYLGDGLSNKAIAFELGVTTTAISSHLNGIYRKLGMDDRASTVQLVRLLRKDPAVAETLAS